MSDITLPLLGESVTEGTITRWFKQVGDTVAEDEALFEVSTDKVDSEVPSPVAGVITEILVPEGETVEVGTVLARVGDAGAWSAGTTIHQTTHRTYPADSDLLVGRANGCISGPDRLASENRNPGVNSGGRASG